MRGPQTITEQRMAKDIQDIEIKVNNIIAQKKKEEKSIAIMMAVGTVIVFVMMFTLFV